MDCLAGGLIFPVSLFHRINCLLEEQQTLQNQLEESHRQQAEQEAKRAQEGVAKVEEGNKKLQEEVSRLQEGLSKAVEASEADMLKHKTEIDLLRKVCMCIRPCICIET